MEGNASTSSNLPSDVNKHKQTKIKPKLSTLRKSVTIDECLNVGIDKSVTSDMNRDKRRMKLKKLDFKFDGSKTVCPKLQNSLSMSSISNSFCGLSYGYPIKKSQQVSNSSYPNTPISSSVFRNTVKGDVRRTVSFDTSTSSLYSPQLEHRNPKNGAQTRRQSTGTHSCKSSPGQSKTKTSFDLGATILEHEVIESGSEESFGRVRSYEGSGLTIRIPRHSVERTGSTSPLFPKSSNSPTSSEKSINKSKSLSPSMDKISSPTQVVRSSSSVSRTSSIAGSRGSTPSSTRSGPSSRPPSGRSSVHLSKPLKTNRQTTPEHDELVRKPGSPTGSEASCHSLQSHSSVHSVSSSISSGNVSSKSQSSLPCSTGNDRFKNRKARASSEPPLTTKPPTMGSKRSINPKTQLNQRRSMPSMTHTTKSRLESPQSQHHHQKRSGESIVKTSDLSKNCAKKSVLNRSQMNHNTHKRDMPVFSSYMSLCQVQQKLHKGEVIEGVLRINPKNYEDAYISAPDGQMDIYIGGVADRNAALNGDIVAVELLPLDEWKILYDKLDNFFENATPIASNEQLTSTNPVYSETKSTNTACSETDSIPATSNTAYSETDSIPATSNTAYSETESTCTASNTAPKETKSTIITDNIKVISYPIKEDVLELTESSETSMFVPLEELPECESSDGSSDFDSSDSLDDVPISVTSANRRVYGDEPKKEVFIKLPPMENTLVSPVVPLMPPAQPDPIFVEDTPELSKSQKRKLKMSANHGIGDEEPKKEVSINLPSMENTLVSPVIPLMPAQPDPILVEDTPKLSRNQKRKLKLSANQGMGDEEPKQVVSITPLPTENTLESPVVPLMPAQPDSIFVEGTPKLSKSQKRKLRMSANQGMDDEEPKKDVFIKPLSTESTLESPVVPLMPAQPDPVFVEGTPILSRSQKRKLKLSANQGMGDEEPKKEVSIKPLPLESTVVPLMPAQPHSIFVEGTPKLSKSQKRRLRMSANRGIGGEEPKKDFFMKPLPTENSLESPVVSLVPTQPDEIHVEKTETLSRSQKKKLRLRAAHAGKMDNVCVETPESSRKQTNDKEATNVNEQSTSRNPPSNALINSLQCTDWQSQKNDETNPRKIAIDKVKKVHMSLTSYAKEKYNGSINNLNAKTDMAYLDQVYKQTNVNPVEQLLMSQVSFLSQENDNLKARITNLEDTISKLQPLSISQTKPLPKRTQLPKGEHNGMSEKTQRIIANINLKPNYKVEDLMKYKDWETVVQKRGRVVFILESLHNRMAVGHLKPFRNNYRSYALFSPTDYRIPRMKIPMRFCPSDFATNSQEYQSMLFLAKIIKWTEPSFAIGELRKCIGLQGELESEISAILSQHSVDFEDFPKEILDSLPSAPYIIPKEEIESRSDFRHLCVFSIDPSTAKDLDDSVSCVALPNGNFEVGVHIADVSHFVQQDSPLDKVASSRATSFYLPEKVIPMLPPRLSEDLCSLNPGIDRLSFSVIWEMSENGDIIDTSFHKSVIKSCCKLTYSHAQLAIDTDASLLTTNDFPIIYNNHSVPVIIGTIKTLNKIACNLRDKRFAKGCLKLQQVKMGFDFDGDVINGLHGYLPTDSNALIEEFMLLANISVARKIYSSYPDTSLLRCHPSPHQIALKSTLQVLNAHGIDLNVTTSKTFMDSLNMYEGDDDYSKSRHQIITALCAKPMHLAEYICGSKPYTKLHHYALNEPLYTHFTSPIRRYADVIVHRLLAACIDSQRFGYMNIETSNVQRLAIHCNSRKYASKSVQESASDVYLGLYLIKVKSLIEDGMVIGVLDKALDIYLLRLGISKRVYFNAIPLDSFKLLDGKKQSCKLKWKRDSAAGYNSHEQILTMFSRVKVLIRPESQETLRISTTLLRPDFKE